MKTSSTLAVFVGTIGCALVLSACAGPASSDQSSDNNDTTQETVEVKYLTSFNTFGRDSYVYVAEETGCFADAGFNVEIQPGTGTVDVLKLVASGQADFGVGDFQGAALTIANEGLPVQIVSAIHDDSLAAIATAEGYGIETPSDLEGKMIADQPGSVNEVLFPVYAEAAGLDADQVEFIPAQPAAIPQLLASKQADAVGQFVVAGGLIKEATGEEAIFLPFSDYLEDLYGNALFASTDLIDSDPDLVDRFNEALHCGLEYTIENSEEAGEILQKYQPTQDAEVAAGEITAMAPYVGDAVSDGKLDPERVDSILNLLFEREAITSEPVADDIVAFDVVE